MLVLLVFIWLAHGQDFDCNGLPCPPGDIDPCGECNGFSDCVDCNGVPRGSSRLDSCGVCNGPNACLECGPRERDRCGVCFGSNSCVDCQSVPFGTARYDQCGVCGGDNRSCVDCAGRIGGSLRYDRCDVCGGDGTSCVGCDGVPNSGLVFDRCSRCGGTNACVDCNGVVNGLGAYDLCDVCDGDNSACRDCAGTVNGIARVNRCGVCTTALVDDDCTEDSVDAEQTQLTLFYVFLGIALGCCACFCCAAAIGQRRRRKDRPLILLLLPCINAQLFTPGQLVAREMCRTSTLNVTRPEMCVPGFDVCTDPHDRPLFRCENGQVSHVQFENVPNLSGTTSDVLLRLLAHSRKITIQSSGSYALSVSAPLRFNQLQRLRLVNVRSRVSLPTLLAVFASSRKLEQLLIENVANLTGRLNEASDLCLQPALIDLVIRNTNISGRIDCDAVSPRWERLITVDLRGNRLTGLFPTLSRFQIRQFQLQNNRLTGTLPAEPLLPRRIRNLFFQANRLTGTIHGAYGQLDNLGALSVRSNDISGTLPVLPQPSLSNLDVSFNRMSGTIPAQFAEPTPIPGTTSRRRFVSFRVNYNQFELPLPNFSADLFNGACQFENNKICSPQEIPAPLLEVFRSRQCSFSVNSATLCAGGCGDRTCVGCDGIVGSGAEVDACGVCAGRNFSCSDCRGTLFGSLRRDACGVCGGDGSTCSDCLGQPNGPAVRDECGVCQGFGASCRDCRGVAGGSARLDACGVCEGRNYSCSDCAGTVGGSIKFDEDGVCGGLRSV
jgi:hypothetical protein